MKYAKKHFDFELKSVTKSVKSEEVIIEGYANTSSKDRVGDVVLPSAFEKSLPTYLNNPVLLVNHDWNDVAGVVQAAEITDKGLYIKARVSDTREDLKTLIREGCLRTFSIGYNELDADMDESSKTKYIKELELLEISVVSVPANTEAMFVTAETKKEEVKAEKLVAVEQESAKSLKDFIVTVKDVVGTSNLGDDLLINVVDYYTLKGGKEVMTKEELISALKAKSLEAAAAEKAKEDQQAPAADAAKPADNADQADEGQEQDMMKAMMDKLDMLGQAMAQVLEALKADADADAQEGDQQAPAKDEAKKVDPKKEDDQMSEEDKKKDAEVAETTEEKSAELSVSEINAEIRALDKQIQELEDAENN